MVASFACKVAQYSLTMTSLLDYWFDIALKEPDVLFLLYRNRLSADCFPVYELSKDFLFMGDKLFQISRETLLYTTLTSGFNENLQDWLLTSDFPGLVITGLLSNFNQICYNEIILSNKKNDLEETLMNNENFKDYREYVTFIMNILAYSTHDSVKIAFLNCFRTRFLNPVIEYYSLNDTYHVNIVFLLSHTIDQLISVPDYSKSCPTTTFIVEELLYDSLTSAKPYGLSLLDLFKKSLLQPHDNIILVLSSFKTFDSFCRSKHPLLISEIFCDEQSFLESSNSMIIHDDSNTTPLVEMVKEIVDLEPLYRRMIFNKLDESSILLEKSSFGELQTSASIKPWFQFSYKKDIPMLIISYLLRFFTNSNDINRALISLIKLISTFHLGKIFNFVLSDTGNTTPTLFWSIFTYLWESFKEYSEKINLGNRLIQVIRPSSDLLSKFNASDESIKSSLDDWFNQEHHTQPITFDILALNLELFKEFTIELFAIHKMRNVINRINRK